MYYHIILTKECNLNCDYCGKGSDTEPKEIVYSINELKKFISEDKNPVLEFYGGEPLLRIETMKKIIDNIHGKYVIQTNGIFLNKLNPYYLKKFHSILVSIDGTKETTDKYRGNGVYDKVIKNISIIHEKGFKGDLVARMTVPCGTDIFENVTHLAKLQKFDHIHWQLGFEMFWIGAEPCAEKWIYVYNSDISKLIDWWVFNMEKGEVIGLVPFIGIMNSLLYSKTSDIRCGSGIDFFSIMPDGRISACPVSIDCDFSILGSIYENTPDSIYDSVRVGEPCVSCDVFDICGGRCLFVNHRQDMLEKDAYNQICTTVKHLISKLKSVAPHIKKLIDKNIIDIKNFDYPEINNGCEIIP